MMQSRISSSVTLIPFNCAIKLSFNDSLVTYEPSSVIHLLRKNKTYLNNSKHGRGCISGVK